MKNSTYFLAVQIQSEGHKQLGAVLQAFSNPSCKGYEPWELHLLPLTVEHVFNHFRQFLWHFFFFFYCS